MDNSSVLPVILIGTLAGFMSGLLGIGGAIIMIPALVYFLGFSQQLAQGTVLLMMVFPVGALAAWKYYQQDMASMKVALLLALFFFLSGYFGAMLAVKVPEAFLKKIFALLLIAIAIRSLFFEKG